MPPITVKKKKLTIKPPGAVQHADEPEAETLDPAADAPVFVQPARAGMATTVFAVVALAAVLLFGALTFLQFSELKYYDQPPPVFLKPGMAVASLPVARPASGAPAEPEPAAE
jgi:hypothetical protein